MTLIEKIHSVINRHAGKLIFAGAVLGMSAAYQQSVGFDSLFKPYTVQRVEAIEKLVSLNVVDGLQQRADSIKTTPDYVRAINKYEEIQDNLDVFQWVGFLGGYSLLGLSVWGSIYDPKRKNLQEGNNDKKTAC